MQECALIASSHPVFDKLSMKLFGTEDVDSIISEPGSKILFLWGFNCPNCEIAKRNLEAESENLSKFSLKWYHCNVYEDFDVSNKFSLHGIPVFFLYQDSKRLGKITSYPGYEKFAEVLNKAFL